MPDLYEVLQVHPRAEPDVVRAAYRALARTYHPDTGGSERRMTELNEAWAMLGDPGLRAAYDAERRRPTKLPVAAARANPHAHDRQAGNDPPPRYMNDAGRTLDFGRYSGWSLEQLVDSDPNYLEWVVRTSMGRRLHAEVQALLALRAAPRGGVGVAPPPTKGRSRWGG